MRVITHFKVPSNTPREEREGMRLQKRKRNRMNTPFWYEGIMKKVISVL